MFVQSKYFLSVFLLNYLSFISLFNVSQASGRRAILPSTLSVNLESFNSFEKSLQMNSIQKCPLANVLLTKATLNLYLRESCLSAKICIVKYQLSKAAKKEFILIKMLCLQAPLEKEEFLAWQQDLEVSDKTPTQARPTVFRWTGGGKEVYLSGSFNNWSKIPLTRR